MSINHYNSATTPYREYKILNLLDFTSKRKRMSVIAQDEDGQLLLLCKGADSIIFERLSKNGRTYEEATTKHLKDYGEAGLRTLALAYRKLEEAEYSTWNNEFIKAKTSIGGDREAVLEMVSNMIEKDLILVGATAVEDKLQKGVPQRIDKLAQAGLKIWVLTGDKLETAINIGFSCSLLRQGMKQICITTLNTDKLAQDSKQDVMASDFAIAQFRFLERLLVVHGHWCYKRIAQMICYFFYKNIAFGLTLFYFEAFASFSGQSVYEDSYMLLFNVVLTSLPVISLGVFEQDVSAEICLQFPAFYQQGPKNLFFDWYIIFGWIGNGLYASIMIFFLNIIFFYNEPFRSGGQTADMSAVGTTMFTCLIWAVNCQIALTMTHFTWIQHFIIWGSVATWYLFLLGYGMMSPVYSTNAFQLLVEALAPAPMYWYATLLVTFTCILPYLVHISFQRCFHPMDHHIIQEIKYYKKDVKDSHMWTRERSKARQETKIGFTARVDAKIRQLRGRLTKKYSSVPSQVVMPPS